VSGLTDVVQTPIYSTAVGLLAYGKDHSGRLMGVNDDGIDLFSKIKSWFQGNF
jgi:cell division protein FtsA